MAMMAFGALVYISREELTKGHERGVSNARIYFGRGPKGATEYAMLYKMSLLLYVKNNPKVNGKSKKYDLSLV